MKEMKKAKETTKRIRLLAVLMLAIATLSLLTVSLPAFGQKAEKWQIVVSKSLIQNEAIKVALDDLKKTGKELGIIFYVTDDGAESAENAIVVGDAGRNKVAAALVKEGKIKPEGVDDPQGYEIISTTEDGSRKIIVAGGSVIGDVYGLYWIWDRLRVFKDIPQINVKRVPALKIRHAYLNDSDRLRKALRYSINLVSGEDPINLVPWDAEPEKTQNKKNREKITELIKYAHSLHIKYLSHCWEFVYHPSLLKEFGATLSPCDPAFWDALQAKYRKLLQAMPELDGVGACTGELTGFGGSYEGFDVMHAGQDCDWGLEKRYRTFIKKMCNVVVGEFDKEYFHQTWVVSSYEQHSQPEVYEKIFTEDVPTKNLYVAPMITQNDRWWFQAYNPTFNVTPHNTIAIFQTMNYYENPRANIFPTFPGQYFQGALQTIIAPKQSNLKGVSCVFVPLQDGWDSISINMYTTFRLAWEPSDDVRKIAEDFASIHFGRAAGKEMAEIYLLSPVAYKYGLHIEPVAYGTFNSLPHIRVGTFPAQGCHTIDNGKEHVEFLSKIYLRCKPWITETLMYLDHGLQTAESMCQKYQQVKPLIADNKLAADVENSLQLTRLLIKTNNLYVKTFFSYFQYREHPTPENKDKLENFFSQLTDTRKQFMESPGYGYSLFGVEQLMKNVEQALEDLPKAEQILAKAPNQEEMKLIIAQQQEKYTQILKEYGNDAVKFLHWEGKVDGIDLLKTKGSNLEIKHLRYDSITGMTYKFFTSLPNKPITVIPMNIKSRSFKPFVLEQPDKNNNYTATIYLSDYPCHGPSWWKFDLYYIPKLPDDVGLEIPWRK